ncbi:MAG: hypothetical protein GX080_00405 [Tissierellia bacterium]|nr:hypothetical protein [Tissierellia bacterium]
MSKLDYEEIQSIQEKTIKKLIKYINENLKEDRSLDSIEFYYPDFDENKTRLAFNVWISTDYRTSSGKSFIELMLDEKSHQLTSLEKSILIERNRSFISLYEIERIDGEYIYAKDLLTGTRHSLLEPNISGMLNPKDLIFGRVGKIIEYKGFIGNINFLPSSIKDEFLEKVFVDYNRSRFKYPDLTIDRYLKLFSINVYKIYTESIYDAIDKELDSDSDATSALYDELDNFEIYLESQVSKSEMKTHIVNLINLFEHYILECGGSLKDLVDMDLEHLFKKAIEDGLISSQQEFSSYVSTLKKYFKYMKTVNPAYKEAYRKILKISRDRFLYIYDTYKINLDFNINRNISCNISDAISDTSFDFIMDYEKFLLFLISNPLDLTRKKKYINRKTLLELNNIMELRENITKKAPNQRDFPLINLFYNFSLANRLTRIQNCKLLITKRGHTFLRLLDEEKFTMFVQYLLSNDIIDCIVADADNNKLANSTRSNLFNLLYNLKEGIYYNYNEFDFNSLGSIRYIFTYLKYMKFMGLIEYSYYPLSFTITHLGKIVFSILQDKNKKYQDSGKIIYLHQ